MNFRQMKSAYFITLLCFLVLGVFMRAHFMVSAAQQLAPYIGREVIVCGAVEPMSMRQQEKFTSAVLQVESLVLASGEKLSYNGRLRVSVAGGKFPEAGKVVLQGVLGELIALRNPGSFDSEAYNKLHNLGSRLDKAQLLATDKNVSLWQQLELWNLALCARMEQAAGKEAGAILSSMVLGGSSKLAEETRDIFTNNGIAHLLSVSGTHLLLLTSLLLAVLKPVPKPWRELIVIVLLAFYAALCGFKPPVLRALAMCSVLLLGGSGAERGRLLCLVAVVLLLVKPLWLQDIGFQLSFAAAAGLLWLLPECKRFGSGAVPEILGEGLAVTFAAQLATLPIEIMHFHQVSIISFVSNLFLVPLLEIAAQLALLGALLPLGEYLLAAAAFILQQVLTQGSWLAALPYSVLVIGDLPLYCLPVYYAALFLLADFSWLQIFSNKERYGAIAFCLIVLISTLCYQAWRTLPLTAYFLDVGQGDCAVIVTPEQKVVVIDTGGLYGLPTGSRVIAPFLRSLGYKKIDILLLSHYDFDHVGGAPSLFRQVQVKQLLLPAELLTDASKALQQEIFLQAKHSGARKIDVAQSGGVYKLDETTRLVVVDTPKQATSGNEASTLAAVQGVYGSVLFTGDMGETRERDLNLGHYTVLKAGHHGSRYSTTSEFLAQVQPELTVISCGKNNRYGHPHAQMLERVRMARSTVMRTDEQGCVKVVFGKQGIACYGYRKNSWQKLQ